MYEYSSGNLIKNPQNYQFSKYDGKNFLKNYKDSRLKFIELLETKFTKKQTVDQTIKNIVLGHNDFQNGLKNENKTNELFKFLLYSTYSGKENEFVIRIIDKFVTKFEIKKRIFSTYNSDLKEIVGDYSDLENYILLSCLTLMRYKKTSCLKFLNVALKLNDTICSQIKRLNTTFDALLCKHNFKDELNFIAELISKKGI